MCKNKQLFSSHASFVILILSHVSVYATVMCTDYKHLFIYLDLY